MKKERRTIEEGDVCSDASGLVVKVDKVFGDRISWHAARGFEVRGALKGEQSYESFSKRFDVVNHVMAVPKAA